uniref:Uncharacterized protein n=1 Tax=Anguilla anguilla TaxID=7936 RepID=A0A0E9UW10_ANGAN
MCKIVAGGINRQISWIGNITNWKKKGKARTRQPYFKLMYGDFIDMFKHLNIDWCHSENKVVYNLLINELYVEF